VQDSTGMPVRGYDDYDAWGYIMGGRSMASSILPSNATRNKFTGKEFDDDYGVNWYDFPARDYDPQIGRFLSRDPHADLYPSLTPYNYAGNNPVNFFDPTGKDSLQAQQLNLALQQTHDKYKGKSLVCNTCTVEAIQAYLGGQGEAVTVPSVLVNKKGEALSANKQLENMEKSSDFEKVTAEEGIEAANNGALVIAALSSEPHGHIDVVGAGGKLSMIRTLDPNARALGTSAKSLAASWSERGTLAWSFGARQPGYFLYKEFTPRSSSPTFSDRLREGYRAVVSWIKMKLK
jgi:RHS repeat-associated protein